MNTLKNFAECNIALFVGSFNRDLTPFEKKAEDYKISLLNKLFNSQLWDLEEEDFMVVFSLCGGGYRRTGCSYPAVKLFASFFEENEEKQFVKLLLHYYAEAAEEYNFNYDDEDNHRCMAEHMLNLAYLAKAVKSCVSNRKLKKKLSKFIDMVKTFVHELSNGFIKAIEL